MEGRLRDADDDPGAPNLSLGRNNGWVIHASAGHSFAGKAVQFQRLNPATGQWVTLKKVLLNSKSSAKFAYALPKGVNHLRVTMSVNQAGAGFLGAIGSTITYGSSSHPISGARREGAGLRAVQAPRPRRSGGRPRPS